VKRPKNRECFFEFMRKRCAPKTSRYGTAVFLFSECAPRLPENVRDFSNSRTSPSRSVSSENSFAWDAECPLTGTHVATAH
jgi:hypothetical protein